MPKQYDKERKYIVAVNATRMKDSGTPLDVISKMLDIPQKTIEKWILHLKVGKIKKPAEKPVEQKPLDLSGVEKYLKKLEKKINSLDSLPSATLEHTTDDFPELKNIMSELTMALKQTNIRFDHFYKVVAEEKEVKELAEKVLKKVKKT